MNLRRLAARRWRAELPSGTGDARRGFGPRETLLIQLGDEGGHRGWGEAAPLPGLSFESLSDVEGVWDRLPETWTTEAALALEASLPPSLSFALETARLDLEGCRTVRRFEDLLGGAARTRQRTAKLVVDIEQLGGLDLEPGRPFKLKFGRPARVAEELSALRLLRAERGLDRELRLDFNESLSVEAWLALVPQLLDLSLAWVEDPVPAEHWVDLPPSPVPLAVDAPLSHASPELRARILARSDSAVVVLKPTLLGGLAEARRRSKAAAEAGRRVVYSHCYEGPIAFSAIAAASLADPAASDAAGLGPHPGLGPEGSRIERLEGSMLVAGTRPGLGFPEGIA